MGQAKAKDVCAKDKVVHQADFFLSLTAKYEARSALFLSL